MVLFQKAEHKLFTLHKASAPPLGNYRVKMHHVAFSQPLNILGTNITRKLHILKILGKMTFDDHHGF